MKKPLVTSIVVLLSLVLSAHEFWLEPEKFIYQWNDDINVRFYVGENFEGQNWSGDSSKIQKLDLYYSNVKDDLTTYMTGNPGDSLQLKVLDEGTSMIAFNSTNSFIELEPEKFKAYLLEDGLYNALEYREANRETDRNGREYYQRSVKTLFQIGEPFGATAKKETGLPVDILLLDNPYEKQSGDTITAKILFEKNPLPHQLVKVWTRLDQQTRRIDLESDENGMIRFRVERQGTWMISTVRMVRIENDDRADWQSYWGSATWGYQE